MELSLFQIIMLALVQGAAELLPVSSSAHVIVAEHLMNIDPSSPKMTFFLVMLHTGTMFAVLIYFWPRWKKLDFNFLKSVVLATFVTGVLGLMIKYMMEHMLGHEIEMLFKSLPLMACALFCVGLLIIFADLKSKNSNQTEITSKQAWWIGVVQAICLPFRGFSRSGATISAGLLLGISKARAEDFSFALAVLITPPVILLQVLRVWKTGANVSDQIMPGMFGMIFSFMAGLIALRWLSNWLENGRWRYFGFYCLFASFVVLTVHKFWN